MADLFLCLRDEKLFDNRDVLWIEYCTMKTTDIRPVQTTKLRRFGCCVTSCFCTNLPAVSLCSLTDCFLYRQNEKMNKHKKQHDATIALKVDKEAAKNQKLVF